MDNKRRVNKQNPIGKTNYICNLFFWYTKDIFWKSNHRNITLDDIYDPVHTDKSEYLGNRLETEWNHELEKWKKKKYIVDNKGDKILSKLTRPSLSKALIRMFFWQNVILSIIQALNFLVLIVCHPIFQGWVIDYFKVGGSENIDERNRAFFNATIMILIKLVTVLFQQHAYQLACRMGMRARVACCSLMYRKTLRLHKSILDQTAAGQVINLMSNDVSRFDMFFQFINFMWITPIQVLLIVYIMWDSIGIILLVGIIILLLIAIPLQSIVTYTSKSLRLKIAILTDKRVQLMSELISGIKVIKMYAWEKPFSKIVDNIRLAEMKKITITSHVRSLFFSSMIYTERTTLFVTLILYVFAGNHLTAEISFVLATYFNILQLSIIYMMPNGLIAAGEVSVSIKRIEEFLLLDEITISEVTKLSEKVLEDDLKFTENKNIDTGDENSCTLIEVNFHRVSANWKSGQLPPTLNDLTFKIKAGSLCALAGNVGSGKSAILQLLLKELQVGAGSVILRQQCDKKLETFQRSGFHTDIDNLRISYASQDAWLFASTVRENILFGEPFDSARYNKVVEVCALKQDFEHLSKGDLSTVGERGSSLSGGQQARINLARAIYRQADVYLLDDPLSAVDSKVACHLFERCIRDFLHDKTRILVTHQLQFLQHVDNIIFVERGCIKYQGSYKNITNINPKIMDMLSNIKNDEVNKNINSKNMIALADTQLTDSISHKNDQSSIKSFNSTEAESTAASVNNEEINRIYSNGTLFKIYLRAGASWYLLGLYITTLIFTQIATSGTDFWLSYWTNMEDMRFNINTSSSSLNITYNLNFNFENVSEFNIPTEEIKLLSTEEAIYIYAIVLCICTFLCLTRSYLIIRICMKASKRLHKLMFSNILHSSMNFFNKNPSGRIMNRFSKDTGAMDELLSRNYTEAIQIFSVMIGILVVIVIVNYWMIITIFIVLLLFWFAKTIYLNTAQKIKRLETAAKSPVFSHVNASLNGLTTIRSCGKKIENRLVMEFDRYQDEHSGTWYMIITTAAAFGMILDFILILLNAVIAYSFIYLNNGNILGGNVGLALSQAAILTGMVQYGFRLYVEVMSQLTSVEKIVQYTNLPKEHPLISIIPLPKNWPQCGRISMKNVSMRYEKNEPLVLKELNVEIEPGWKVGIIGRTGAGKSSIIAALFRLTGENLKGEIIIDGIDTSQIGLQELRAHISIIPQEPVLFSQSLRYNLDPMEQHEDSVLWEALCEVELNDLSLDQQIAEKGSNLSVGQRQLICLARAIIRQNLILVLDEATANIDAHTDSIIQNTIRKKFTGCTVLTVAHRLNTIIDSDRVIVMDNGSVVEFGCPYELLTNNMNSYFFQMVNQTGKILSKKLETLAKEAYLQNIQQNSHISEGRVNNVQEAIQSEENYDIRL
ncbi:PREDICTED: probable multidrug resistance-associated protein lethal(2)03659 [Ceratosolen solmsi marchali]|uniref:Probable multidrug resistance-associated protein lethal(2)03659 n=1 Tax=Ceratosolen solmsi marchali TaxID=326594 RepID=A0AAJ7E2T3_9HYME|nr:PREDICTED: probable multidrug resistance-associated protein lethal(2)03659 [Ceratosolen solmsi marchali]